MEVTPISLAIEASRRDSFEEFREEMSQAMLFPAKRKNRIYAIQRALETDLPDGLYVEFGVAAGAGCRLFGKFLAPQGKHMHGFDSFLGLEEDWTGWHNGRAAGAFTQGGELPTVPGNVTLVKGWIQDTLPAYLEQTDDAPFSFIPMDMDTFTPTRCALDLVKPRLRAGTIILFDELYGYPGWRHHEYKALEEVLDRDDYRFLCFSNEAVAIQMVRTPDLDAKSKTSRGKAEKESI
jgi:hypothetical protein